MTRTNPLVELLAVGQSPWLDNIHRGLLRTGALAKLVKAGEVTGLTSNPTIFEQAIARSTEYDEALAHLARQGRSADAIASTLMIEDIQAAADLFAPLHKKTRGRDGFVSIEVSPALAHDTDGTVREANRLWRAVRRPNLMIKIPATKAGVPAVEECIAEGLNVNVTLIFALDRYEEVMEAYLTGLERRLDAGRAVDRIASVASFFVSRVDTAVDRLLDERIRANPDGAAALEALKGKAAIANATLAYAAFKRKFAGTRFGALAREGAHVQRPLWASTSTKNPAYPDTYYVEALVGPDTVDTLPPATLAAYRDHGTPAVRLDGATDAATALLARLAEVGIRMEAVTQTLEVEGVRSFAGSFETLLAVVAARREAVVLEDRTTRQLGPYARRIATSFANADQTQVGERLWRKDPTLWKPADAAAQAEIRERLGWLDVVGTMRGHLDALRTFAADVRAAGFTHALLCGMGGSSLAPEVLRRTLGVGRGGLDLAILDSTDPGAVVAAAERSDPAKTLYIVSSKSGSTTEPNAFMEFFWAQLVRLQADRAGRNFVAITDPGTALERRARERGFREVFLNPPDIGGRYSALSYVGLVPAALMGHDVGKLLDRAGRMLRACGPGVRAAENPGLALGAILGTLARAGRDKLTLVLPERLVSFGDWVEQLVAESTGKEGRGIVPVVGETLGTPREYGSDRVFVALQVGTRTDRRLAALARAGHPVVTVRVADAYDLAAEFVRWEVATAIAGWVLDLNPFDQPNVQEAKDHTVRLLAEHASHGHLPDVHDGVPADAPDLAERIATPLRALKGRGYVALTAYVAPTPKREAQLRALAAAMRARLGAVVTVAFGPRFLHSTGQLHKGGPATVLVVQLLGASPADVAIPGERYSFAVLEGAQASGDAQALAAHGRPVVRVQLGEAVDGALAAMVEAFTRRPARPQATLTRRRAVRTGVAARKKPPRRTSVAKRRASRS